VIGGHGGRVVGGTLFSALAAQNDEGTEPVVRITAKRFRFDPSDVVVEKGRPVVLEFSSLDFVHGFNVPALKLRADPPPVQVTRVRFTPERAGEFPFACDNFCGEGHEEMHGRIVVRD
jgi:cytochrome c oxidase subunit 2